MAVHRHGGLAAASLEFLRPLADEIVIAFDSRISDDELGPLEKVADVLLGFEWSGANRFRPWLREQAHGDWLLLLDSDELVSTELLSHIPDLILRRDIAGYQIPCWWIFPEASTRLISPPWDKDHHLRLVRNDSQVSFPATKHTGAESNGPLRLIGAPFFHLELILSSEADRRAKVERYNNESFPLFAPDGRSINEAYYLPELSSHHTGSVPAVDSRNISNVLGRRNDRAPLATRPRIASVEDVKLWLPLNLSEDFDYRGSIEFLEEEHVFVAGTASYVEVEITNHGTSVWPRSDAHGARLFLSYHWKRPDGSFEVWDGERTPLRSRILPGERVKHTLWCVAPAKPGRFFLVTDLVHEDKRWFAIDETLATCIEPPVREQLATACSKGLVPLETARVLRRKLRDSNALSKALQASIHDEPINSPVDLMPGDWSLNAATLNFLLKLINQGGLRRILEFGSGISTVVLGHELLRRSGSILSVEHDEMHARRTREWLNERNLGSASRVITAGLAETEACGIRTICYEFGPTLQTEIEQFSPDLIVIDGPSQESGASRLATAPCLGRILQRLTPFAMDDGFRDAELAIAERWQKETRVQVEGLIPVGRGLLAGVVGKIPGPTTPSHWSDVLSMRPRTASEIR
jgi:hypothetical protein